MAHAPYPSRLGDLLKDILPDVLRPSRLEPVTPLASAPTATEIAPNAKLSTERPLCACGRLTQFKEIRNGRPRYRGECDRCRKKRKDAGRSIPKPVALPHRARPRCAIPWCPNAVSVRVVPRHERHPVASWVPLNSPGVVMASPWCYKHRLLNDRPLGFLTPPPAHPTDRRQSYARGLDQWLAWRRRFRRGLGLPELGILHAQTNDVGDWLVSIEVKGQGMRVTAWPDLIAWVAWWTARMPPHGLKVQASPALGKIWPTYGRAATDSGVSPALLAWVVWELTVGRVAVEGCPVQRYVCLGAQSSYTPEVKFTLDPDTWHWTKVSPARQLELAAVRWSGKLPMSPVHQLVTRQPKRLRVGPRRR